MSPAKYQPPPRKASKFPAPQEVTDHELDFIINIARWRGDLTTNLQTEGKPNADFRQR
jgi:hypothetical protein